MKKSKFKRLDEVCFRKDFVEGKEPVNIYKVHDVLTYDGENSLIHLANREKPVREHELERLLFVCEDCIRSKGIHAFLCNSGVCDLCGKEEDGFGNFITEQQLAFNMPQGKGESGLDWGYVTPAFQIAETGDSCCPDCGYTKMDRVLGENPKYRYRCNDCGHSPVTPEGTLVQTEKELKEWLSLNKKVLGLGEQWKDEEQYLDPDDEFYEEIDDDGIYTLCMDGSDLFFLNKSFRRTGRDFRLGGKVNKDNFRVSEAIIKKIIG